MESKIKFGSNRIVLIGKKFVYKIPILFRGMLANYIEWVNYINNPDIVAATTRKWYGLKQERLYNLETLPKTETHKIHNRIQRGQDCNGQWKFFDYEDVKYYLKGEYK